MVCYWVLLLFFKAKEALPGIQERFKCQQSKVSLQSYGTPHCAQQLGGGLVFFSLCHLSFNFVWCFGHTDIFHCCLSVGV